MAHSNHKDSAILVVVLTLGLALAYIIPNKMFGFMNSWTNPIAVLIRWTVKTIAAVFIAFVAITFITGFAKGIAG